MKRADMITGIVLLVLAGYVMWESMQMPPSATFGPGSGFLPFWVGVILAVLAGFLVASVWTRKMTQKDSVNPFPGAKALLAITGVLGGLAAYIFLIEVLGFLVDTFLYVAFLVGMVERQRWSLTLGVAIVTTASLYIVFQVLLGISLPKGAFGF